LRVLLPGHLKETAFTGSKTSFFKKKLSKDLDFENFRSNWRVKFILHQYTSF
jgi:hypothetical protein